MSVSEAAQRQQVVTQATRALTALRDSIMDKAVDAPIATDARSLGGIADILAKLLQQESRPEAADPAPCADPDCFCHPVDGVRLWVPAALLDVERARLASERETATRRGTALSAIAGWAPPADVYSLLCDWPAIVAQMQDRAREALGACPPSQRAPMTEAVPAC